MHYAGRGRKDSFCLICNLLATAADRTPAVQQQQPQRSGSAELALLAPAAAGPDTAMPQRGAATSLRMGNINPAPQAVDLGELHVQQVTRRVGGLELTNWQAWYENCPRTRFEATSEQGARETAALAIRAYQKKTAAQSGQQQHQAQAEPQQDAMEVLMAEVHSRMQRQRHFIPLLDAAIAQMERARRRNPAKPSYYNR